MIWSSGGAFLIKVNARKKFYNEEYESEEWYTGVSKLKKVRVKDRDDLYVMHYYWKDEDGELWSDFDDPTANNRRDFIAYRQVKGYLSPEQIKELIDLSGHTLRSFSDYTNLGLSTLSQLTNNLRVQTPQQENLLKMLRDYFDIHKRLPDLHKPDEMKEIASEISLETELVWNTGLNYSNETDDGYSLSLKSNELSISEAA